LHAGFEISLQILLAYGQKLHQLKQNTKQINPTKINLSFARNAHMTQHQLLLSAIQPQKSAEKPKRRWQQRIKDFNRD